MNNDSLEERMLEAIRKIIKEGRDGFNLEGDAAKACASIAQEEAINFAERILKNAYRVDEHEKWALHKGKNYSNDGQVFIGYTTSELFDLFNKK